MPSKELFNQPLKQELSVSDHIAVGIPGMTGCDNLLISDWIRATGMTLINRTVDATTDFSFDPGVEFKIYAIDFKNTGGDPSNVYASCGDEEVVPVSECAAGQKLENSVFKSFTSAITIGISASTVTVVIYYVRNPY